MLSFWLSSLDGPRANAKTGPNVFKCSQICILSHNNITTYQVILKFFHNSTTPVGQKWIIFFKIVVFIKKTVLWFKKIFNTFEVKYIFVEICNPFYIFSLIFFLNCIIIFNIVVAIYSYVYQLLFIDCRWRVMLIDKWFNKIVQ